ncbi:MAG: hypothetical protein AAB474_02005 [Patescibacteria group bacterium]
MIKLITRLTRFYRVLLFSWIFLFVPFFAFADHNLSHTIEQLNAQIKTLQTQVNTLQNQINVLQQQETAAAPKPIASLPEIAPTTVSETATAPFPTINSSSFVGTSILRPDVYDYGPSIINDGGIYRMYWCSARIGGGDSIWYAQSSDGVNWSDLRVILNPTPNSEETDFNADGHICDPSVVKTGGIYYLYYTAASFSGKNNRIFLAKSTDGVNWIKYPSNSNPKPVIQNTIRSQGYGIGQSAVFFLNNKFYHYFTNTDLNGEMLAFSTDGINWTIQNNNQPVFTTTNFVPVYLKDYNVFFAVYGHNELNHNDLYYSFSKDGITWNSKTFSDSPKIAVGGNRGSIHNAGILTDIAGNVSGSSFLVYYGAGDAGTVQNGGFTNAASWNIDITRINFSVPLKPGTIQGFKLKMPGNLAATPPGGETVRLDGGSPTAANPYFFTGVSAGTHTVSVSVPSGWSAGYTLCYSTQTNCGAANDPNNYHGASPISGSSISISVPSGGFADLWWHFTASAKTPPPPPPSPTQPPSGPPGIIQGFKLKMPGNLAATPPGGETVRLDGGSPTAANPYFFTGVSAGTHTVSVSVPSGWSAGYTLCYSTQTNCGAANDPNNYHGASPISGSSVSVSVPSGGFADLWWHYTLSTSETPPQIPPADSTSPPKTLPAKFPLYRLYNPAILKHLYTINENEKNYLIKNSGWVYENVAGYLYETQQTETYPLYHLYNPVSFDHLYTMSSAEKKAAENAGYVYQAVSGYLYSTQQSGTAPFYRMFSVPGGHFYTMNAAEKNNATQNLGYIYEGITGFMHVFQDTSRRAQNMQLANALESIRGKLELISIMIKNLK